MTLSSVTLHFLHFLHLGLETALLKQVDMYRNCQLFIITSNQEEFRSVNIVDEISSNVMQAIRKTIPSLQNSEIDLQLEFSQIGINSIAILGIFSLLDKIYHDELQELFRKGTFPESPMQLAEFLSNYVEYPS